MTRAEMDRRMDAHFGFEVRDDIEGVLATLSPDVEHDIVGWPTGPTFGREGARPFYKATFADFDHAEVTTRKRLYGENFLVDESLWKGNVPGRPFGFEGKGRSVQFRLLHVLEFADNGEITRESVWMDLAGIIRQLPQT